MPSIKEYDRKLGSLKNSMKMTSTMKLVSASKLRKAQDAQRNGMHYAQRVNEMIADLAGAVEASAHPLLMPRNPVKSVLILLFESDRGLCGAFNNNLNRQVLNWIEIHKGDYEKISLRCCGRRGNAYFQKRATVDKHYEGVTARPSYLNADMVGDEVQAAFLDGTYDEVILAYNVFKNPLVQTPTFRKILPIEADAFAQTEEKQETNVARLKQYILEPGEQQLLDRLIPRVVNFSIYFALLENAAGEHGSRMTAMDNASTNCGKLIDDFTLLRNRARQAGITNELIEIVSGAEAL